MTEHLAFGTILAYGNGESPSEEFTILGQVGDISGPSMSREIKDVTHHQSPPGYKQIVGGLRDPGEITFTVFYDPGSATHDFTTGLGALFNEDDVINWKLVFPVEAVIGYWGLGFSAIMTKFDPQEPVNESLVANVTLAISGPVSEIDVDISEMC